MNVYKYLAPDRIDILENKNIRFTQARYLNDPFESLPFISKLMSDIDSSDFYKKSIDPIIKETGNRKLSINDIPIEFRNEIPKEVIDFISTITINQGLSLIPEFHPENLTKKLFSSSAEETKINYSEKLKESWNKLFGILSLTQTNDNITMWSHYAKNHEGFVIEFDPDNKFFNKKRNENDAFGFLREVKYSEKRPDIELIGLQKPENEFVEFIATNILFTKSQDWSNEEELRLVIDLSTSDDKLIIKNQEIYLFKLPPMAIKSVFIGVNASESFKDEIKTILKKTEFSHVILKYGSLDLKDYKIRFN
ncbi:MAG TPA: DUF2971 domain-containing protein [Flavobacterium sp.]|nr:DUF2971 domain-containing protein [Flavobacterium sp.]